MNNFCTKIDICDKMKYYRLPNNTKTQQEITKENSN